MHPPSSILHPPSYRIAKAVMKANGGPCNITVGATCYEYIPSETYECGEECWEKLQKSLMI